MNVHTSHVWETGAGYAAKHVHGSVGVEAEVILASTCETALPLVTMRLRYPRFIHSELMTHRVFSRNARSSRAVPVKRMIEEVRNTPVVPWHWGKNQKGMQASEECNEPVILQGYPNYYDFDTPISREEAWKLAAKRAVEIAKGFMESGYHKQVVNRLLEPFMFIDTLVTANQWANFFHLRDHPDAEPHIRDLAKVMHDAFESAHWKVLKHGEWHMPYIQPEERHEYDLATLQRLSAARCARISYAPFDGDARIERELERFQQLIGNDAVHASPLEHQATPDRVSEYGDWENGELHGNLPGWVQFRKMIPNEAIFDGQ